MLYTTSLEEFKESCQQASRAVVAREIYGDLLTPASVFQALGNDYEDVILLDSSDHKRADEACIYIGLNAIAHFVAHGSQIVISEQGEQKRFSGDAFAELRKFYYRNKCDNESLAKFAGGMIGLASYDSVRLFENIPNRHADEHNIPDLEFKFYATNLVFDKRSGKLVIAKVVDIDGDVDLAYQQAITDIQNIIEKIFLDVSLSHAAVAVGEAVTAEVSTDLSDDEYMETVKKAKDYIANGEAFQVVTSRSFSRKYNGEDFNVYRAFRVLNPSPYQFFIRNKDYTVVGSSPEKLVSLQQGIVELTPIAGTRPRGKTRAEDEKLAAELKADEKEMAEHMMLVDLGRNDVGAVSEPGSVHVTDLAYISRFSRVMHITSRVEGKIRKNLDAFDVLKFAFPAGTLSGAPKIRAMEIIDELENSRRGIYAGAVCAIDNKGQLDSCIIIRTVFIKNKVATVRAGAGIVLDSDPQAEADETSAKDAERRYASHQSASMVIFVKDVGCRQTVVASRACKPGL